MWFKSKKIIAGNGVKISIEEVKCETCKHKIEVQDAQKVIATNATFWYCVMHEKPYDIIKRTGRWEYFPDTELRFFSDGKPPRYFKTIPASEKERTKSFICTKTLFTN